MSGIHSEKIRVGVCAAIALIVVCAQAKPPASSRSTNTNEPIRDLAVRIKTDSGRGAGTNNAVYFDIGPLAWKLNKPKHNDFEKGSDDTYDLIRDGRLVSAPAQAISLTTADILWLRLHKKGIGGVTGTGDGFGGAWRPATVVLMVNGREFRIVSLNSPLNSRCWYWRSEAIDEGVDLVSFAHSLRMQPNKPLNALAKVTGVVTTPLFKKRGISGWLRSPRQKECPASHVESYELPVTCASGEVINKANSTDGLQTIDLKVTTVERGEGPSLPVVIDVGRFTQPRYLRVESRYGHSTAKIREPARICGRLRWDTDFEGWWEIHPRSTADIQALSSK